MLSRLTAFQNEPLVKTAYEICRWHHERYDGRGYPDGLKGEEIPISAQAVAMADVYDALTSDRCYHKARPHEEALAMIRNNECGVFNPLLMQCLVESADDIRAELAVVSPTVETERDLQKVTGELKQHEELTASEQVFQALKVERQRTHFFASLNHYIQFDYMADPPMLSFNDEGMRQLGLSSSTFNPYESRELHQVISTEELLMLNALLHTTTVEQPTLRYVCKLRLRDQPEQEYALCCRSLWSDDIKPRYLGAIGQVMKPDK